MFKEQNSVKGISMTDQEKEQIITFLKTLTDDDFLNDTRFSEF